MVFSKDDPKNSHMLFPKSFSSRFFSKGLPKQFPAPKSFKRFSPKQLPDSVQKLPKFLFKFSDTLPKHSPSPSRRCPLPKDTCSHLHSNVHVNSNSLFCWPANWRGTAPRQARRRRGWRGCRGAGREMAGGRERGGERGWKDMGTEHCKGEAAAAGSPDNRD